VFAQGLLEALDPLALCPAPSVCVAQIGPDLSRPMPAAGLTAPRGSVLESLTSPDAPTPCRFLTTRAVRIRPLSIGDISYHAGRPRALDLPGSEGARAALRIGFKAQSGATLGALCEGGMRSLPLFARGTGSAGLQLLEIIDQRLVSAWLIPAGGEPLRLPSPTTPGFGALEALLPAEDDISDDRRILREYFLCREASAFVEIGGLEAGADSDAEEFDVLLLFDSVDDQLASAVDADTLMLHCAPAVNVFPKRAARAPAEGRSSRFPVIPDRGRPLDYEVYRVTGVTAHSTSPLRGAAYVRFYAGGQGRYFAAERRPRPLTDKERRYGRRTGYAGGDVFVSLTDAGKGPIPDNVKEVSIRALCTNRHLPLSMPTGRLHTDFEHELGRSVASIRVVAGPTEPRSAPAEHAAVSLALRTLAQQRTRIDTPNAGEAAEALRGLLSLSAHPGSRQHAGWIDSVRAVRITPGVRRIHRAGPVVTAHGREIEVEIDREPFDRGGAWLFGVTLERALSARSAINRYTRLSISTRREGVILEWPARLGPTETL